MQVRLHMGAMHDRRASRVNRAGEVAYPHWNSANLVWAPPARQPSGTLTCACGISLKTECFVCQEQRPSAWCLARGPLKAAASSQAQPWSVALTRPHASAQTRKSATFVRLAPTPRGMLFAPRSAGSAAEAAIAFQIKLPCSARKTAQRLRPTRHSTERQYVCTTPTGCQVHAVLKEGMLDAPPLSYASRAVLRLAINTVLAQDSRWRSQNEAAPLLIAYLRHLFSAQLVAQPQVARDLAGLSSRPGAYLLLVTRVTTAPERVIIPASTESS